MGETFYILIDQKEKRTLVGHNGDLNDFVAALAKDPATIADFNRAYQEIAGEPFYTNGNRPRVPEELSLDTIRTVLGMNGRSDNDVLSYWIRTSLYEGANYQSYAPDEKTENDIPELTEEMIDEWKEEDPEAEEFPTANDYRRSLCNDGIVVADLRTKELRYISGCGFEIPRERPNKQDKEWEKKHGHFLFDHEYSLPLEWRIVAE